MVSETLPKLPVINLSDENLKPGTSDWISTCNDVIKALEEYGCFIAVYDRVPVELHNAVLSAAEELFTLPVETSYGFVGGNVLIPLHESLGIIHPNTIESVQSFTSLMWPSGNDHFSESIFSYAKLVAELDQMVKKMVFESYGVGKYYESHIESTSYLLRPNKYRPPVEKETNIGVTSHTDKSFMTIFHQNHANGLQTKARDGKWISFEDASPSSFIVMAGESFLAWSNDRIHAPNHRVIMNGDEVRYSLALFSFSDEMVKVPEELVDDKHPLKFKPFNRSELLQHYYTARRRISECTVRNHFAI
ncbi:Isopenicillin N synthase-like, Fe(2+) 2OG dioxygenase domain [Dillenia turbinata]|uniref:Isopenicillin N synthase-like, Fe(2+) 2OG dioxygenase domain n=1 Tax=Dillenia turbinata TaxID=194707 RepID=A0AAN8UDR9_9MAGN